MTKIDLKYEFYKKAERLFYKYVTAFFKKT